MARDLTQKQFDEACERHGFRSVGVMGYFQVTPSVSVSAYNAGTNRRAQLAYLIKQQAKHEKRAESAIQ